MSETYEPGELFVYMNGDHWELGEVKSANNTGTGYFCWYSMGDTAANTPTSHMHKLANAGWSHIEKLRKRIKELEECIRGDAEGIYRLAKNTGYLHTDELMKSVNNHMRELGIEVDA